MIVEGDGAEAAAAAVRGLGPVVVGQHVNRSGTPIVECWSGALAFAFHDERWATLSQGTRALVFYASTDAGSFGFRYYEDGELLRRLDALGNVERAFGAPLPAEATIGHLRDESAVFALIAALEFQQHHPRRRRDLRFLRQVA